VAKKRKIKISDPIHGQYTDVCKLVANYWARILKNPYNLITKNKNKN
jgi:hypothetical protein